MYSLSESSCCIYCRYFVLLSFHSIYLLFFFLVFGLVVFILGFGSFGVIFFRKRAVYSSCSSVISLKEFFIRVLVTA